MMIDLRKIGKTAGAALRRVKSDESGLAVVEFAVSLPFFMGLTIGGFEIANYAQTVMKLNQITVHTADGAARMGEGGQLTDRRISELQINDVFAGTIREGESLLLDGEHEYTDPSTEEVTLRGNARIILSSIEPVNSFDENDPKYRIRWQRCVGGGEFYSSNYGNVDDSSEIDGMDIDPDPTVTEYIAPPENGAVMFVEMQYYFRPLIMNGFTRLTNRTITQTAAMVVRDNRDYSTIYNTEAVQMSICDGNGGGDDYVS